MNLWNLLKSWFGRKNSLPPGFQMIKRPDGSYSLVDQITIDYMEPTAPDPTQESLDVILKQLRKVRVCFGSAKFGQQLIFPKLRFVHFSTPWLSTDPALPN